MFKGLFRIDKSYWFLVVPLFYALLPWLQFRMRGIVAFSFCLPWLLPKLSKLLLSAQWGVGKKFVAAILGFVTVQLGLPFVFAIVGKQDLPPYYSVATITMQTVFIIVAYYSVVFRKWRELRFLLVVMAVALLLAALSALRGLHVEGLEGARGFATLDKGAATGTFSSQELELAENIFGLGLGGYSFMYVCAWIFSVALFSIGLSRETKTKLFIAIPLVAGFLCVNGGGLGTPMGIIAFAVVIFAVWRICKSRRMVMFLSGMLVVTFFLMATVPQVFSFASEPLRGLAGLMESGSIKERLVALADSTSGDRRSYAYERAQLQLKSLNAFRRYPLMGVYGPSGSGRQIELGGHSYFMDILGAYGIVGFCVWLFFMVTMSRFLKAILIACEARRWIVLSTLYMGIFFFSSVVNPVTFDGVVVLLIVCFATFEATNRLQWNAHRSFPGYPYPQHMPWGLQT